jgi:hypothetical protein
MTTVKASSVTNKLDAISAEEEAAETLIKQSFPDLDDEILITNNFYDSLEIPYCKKCGERSRTLDGQTLFCPISKPSCAGFSV